MTAVVRCRRMGRCAIHFPLTCLRLGAALCLALAPTGADRVWAMAPLQDGVGLVSDGDFGPTGPRVIKSPPVLPSIVHSMPRVQASTPQAVLPPVDVGALLAQDALSADSTGRLRVGIVRPMRIVPGAVENGGQWRRAADGRLWTMDIVVSGAVAVRVHLTDVNLPPGAQMFAYAPDHPEGIDGPYEGRGICDDGQMWTGAIEGERVRLECFVPANALDALPDKPFVIDQLLHMYRDPLSGAPPRAAHEADGGIAGTCHNDVTCYSAWTNVSHGTCRISFVDNGNGFLVTGTFINPQNGDLTPYVVTTRNGISTNTVAQTAQFFWLYQSSTCNGTPPTLSSVPKSSVATLGASVAATDFTLLVEEGALPCGLFWPGFDANAIADAQSSACIHQPGGGAKRISFGTKADATAGCTTGSPNFVRVNWTDGAMASGSEGAGVFRSDTQRFYGLFACGNLSCSSPFDDFGAMSASYSASTTVQNLVAGGSDDALEPNDSCATAITIAEGNYTNRIVKYNHDDWFRIAVPAGGQLSATVTFTDANGDIDLELFGTCGGSLLASSSGSTNAESIIYTNTGAATNLLLHVFLSDCDTRNSYTMNLSASLPNDTCATATVIPGTATAFNPAPYSTAQADASAGEPQESCEVSNVGVSHTVWYSFTPCGNGTVTIDTFGSTYDTVLAMFTGTCASATQVACSDNGIGTQARILNFALTGGTTYLIKASAYNTTGSGGTLDFNFSYTPAAPPNDLCSAAVVIPNNLATFNPTPFCTVGATATAGDPVQNCGFTSNSNSVWYRITPSGCRTVSIDTNDSTYDTVLSVFTGTCGSATEIACDDDSGTGLNSQLINLHLNAGTQYLIEVSDFGNPDGGTLNFHMNIASCCVGDIVPGPLGNGMVDVNDLLGVVTTWGACPTPCPPHCAADISPAGGNCAVDVNDLLAVITHWGPCPP